MYIVPGKVVDNDIEANSNDIEANSNYINRNLALSP